MIDGVRKKEERYSLHHNDVMNIFRIFLRNIECPTTAIITLLQKGKKKEHLNPFGWGDLVAGHYIEDGTRWIEREEGKLRDPQFA